MKVITSYSPQQYISHIKNRLYGPLPFGWGERFTGLCLGHFFAIDYFSGKEFGRRNYPIVNKAIGIVRNMDGETTVSYFIFRGLTAPSSLLIIFLGAFLIFKIIHAPGAVYFATGWTIAIALHTFLCTALSETGRYGTERLRQFLSP